MSTAGSTVFRRAAVAIAVATIALAACSDDEGGRSDVATSEGSGNAAGQDPLGTLGEALASSGGEIVDDTEIRYTDGEGSLSIGGLEVAMPILADLDYYALDANNTVPPSWPTLAVAQLHSHDDPSGNPTVGLAVLAQTVAATDDAIRERLVEDSFEIAGHAESEVVNESVTTNPQTDVTCWVEIRYGSIRRGFDPAHRATVLFAGPGIASSGIILWAPGAGFQEIPTVVGDLVESVCGTRPDGL